jgi:hypothetical protein
MSASTNLDPVSVREIVDHIFTTRQITRSDQAHFMAIVLGQDSLTVEDRIQIDRVFEGLRRGVLRVVD